MALPRNQELQAGLPHGRGSKGSDHLLQLFHGAGKWSSQDPKWHASREASIMGGTTLLAPWISTLSPGTLSRGGGGGQYSQVDLAGHTLVTAAGSAV